MVSVRFFGPAREAAGASSMTTSAETVAVLIDELRERYGPDFGSILDGSKIWVDGEPATGDTALADGVEVGVLPPVSGG